MLLKCLQLTDDKALEMALEITLRFIKEQDTFFQDHLQTLIPQLLKLSVYKSSMVSYQIWTMTVSRLMKWSFSYNAESTDRRLGVPTVCNQIPSVPVAAIQARCRTRLASFVGWPQASGQKRCRCGSSSVVRRGKWGQQQFHWIVKCISYMF